MGVAEEMCGRSSHEAMLRVQDAELRLLDSVHHFVLMRVDNDRKYAAGLAKILHATVAKGGDAEFVECCTVFKAWETVIKETERLMKCVRAKTEHLATHTLEVLTQLMTEKKAARRKYADDRHRLDADFAKVQEEVSRLRQEYQKAVERLALDRARYLELMAKGKLKSGQKCDEAKSKFFRSAVRLHKLHNDYVLALHTAQGHQTALRERVLPALVQGHLDTQEATVYKTKYVLQDLLRQTDPSSPDFLSISHNLQDALALVIPGSEYTTGFTQLHKSPLPPETEFTFDPRLLEDYTGTLTPDLIEVNELTADSLNHRLTRLTEDIEQMREELSRTSQLQQTSGLELSSLTSGLSDQSDVELLNSYIDKRASVNHHNKQIQEMEGQLGKLERLAALVRAPLEQLGTEPPPPALDVQEAGEGMWETSAPSLTPAALTSSLKDTHFIKSLSKMNPFKKAAGRAATSSSSSNLSVGGGEEEDRRSMHEDGGHAEEGRKKQTHSYERSEPFLNNSNGPDRTSMVKMKEQGHMVDLDINEAKSRMADADWFHGVLPREEVQRLLVSDGDYLVRESKNKKTNETQFVLSVFWAGHKHFIIQYNLERGWHFEGQAYPTIQELVRRQFESRLPVTTKSGAVLKKAVLREWELLNDDIELKMKIGTGNFGEVYKGVYRKELEVAVKTCKDTLTEDQKLKFLQEGRILKQYKHPNIVRYVGIAAQKQPVMIVMEFIPKGALLQFLKSEGSSQSVKQLVQMCVDAASGMEYLEGRGCIHRDLAARNCLVGEQNVIKISDFGMSREEQEYTVSTGMKQIPVKWTAPEALNFGKYTSLCDVWSFGVLMWEIFSCGKSPYTGMNNSRAREWIEDGHRLEAPPNTPDSVYSLMLGCWHYLDEERPHFRAVHKTLLDICKKL